MPVLAFGNEDIAPPDTIHKLMRDVLPASQRSANVTQEQILKVKETLRKDRDQLKLLQHQQQQQQHQYQPQFLEMRWHEQVAPHDSVTSLPVHESQAHNAAPFPADVGHPTLRVRSSSGSRPSSISGSQGSGVPLWSLHESSPASLQMKPQVATVGNKARASGNGGPELRGMSQTAGSPSSARSSQGSTSFSSKPAPRIAAPGELLSRSRSMSTGRLRSGDGPSTPHSGAVSNISAALALYEQRGGLRSQSNADLTARVHQASDTLTDWQRRLRAAGANTIGHETDRQSDMSRRVDSPPTPVNQASSSAELWHPQEDNWQQERGWQEKVTRRHSLNGVAGSGDLDARANRDNKATLHTSESRVKYDLKETSNKLADVIQHCRELQARKSTSDTSIAALGAAAIQLQNHTFSAPGATPFQNLERINSSSSNHSQQHALHQSQQYPLNRHSSFGQQSRASTPMPPTSPASVHGSGALSDRSHYNPNQPQPEPKAVPATNPALIQQNAELMAQLRQAQAAIKELEVVAAERTRMEVALKEARRETEVQRQLYQQMQRAVQHLQLQQAGASDETLIRSAEMRALDAEARCSSLQSEVSDLRMQLTGLSSTGSSVMQECESLKAQIADLHSQLAAAASRTSDTAASRRVAALEAELDVALAQQQRNATARREAEARVAELQDQLRSKEMHSKKAQELEADLARVTSERDTSRRNGEEISRKLKDVEAAFERITRQMEDLHEAHANAMDAKVVDASKHHAAALARLVELEQQLQEADRKAKKADSLQSSMEDSDKTISELNAKLRKAQEQLAASQQLASNLAEGNSALAGLQERLTEQQNRVSSLQLQLQTANMAQTTMNNDLQQKELLVQELSTQVQVSRQEAETYLERAETAEQRSGVAEKELVTLRQQVQEARHEIDELNKAGKGVTRDMVRKVESMERIIKDQEEKLQIKAQEVLDARDTIAICEEQIAHFEDELAGLRSDYSDLNTRHTVLKREKEALQTKLASTKAQLEKFTGPGGPQGRVRELEAQVNALQANVESLKRERKEVEAKSNELDQQLHEKEDMIIELDGRVTVLTSELERLYAIHGQP